MRQPPRFEDATNPQHVFPLSKAIYGLKQGPRACHQRLGSVLMSNGFMTSTADSSLFILKRLTVTIYLFVCVDDIIVLSSSSTAIDRLVVGLVKIFKSKISVLCITSWEFRFIKQLKVSIYDNKSTHLIFSFVPICKRASPKLLNVFNRKIIRHIWYFTFTRRSNYLSQHGWRLAILNSHTTRSVICH